STGTSPLACCFFFCCYGRPRDLHSFPTRRSSDLLACHEPAGVSDLARQARKAASDRKTARVGVRKRALVHRLRRCFGGQGDNRRSEEHTSELQSRENLVCRLLLEKKKKNDKNNKS